MEALAVLFMLVLAGVLGYLVAKNSEPPSEKPLLDPEAELRAAVDLRRIRRNLDVSLTKTEQRREAERVRRRIGEEMGDERP
jgi:hypothetical protein